MELCLIRKKLSFKFFSRRMSSWVANPTRPSSLSAGVLFCKTSSSGYGSNFFNFFMCYLFAQSKKKQLYLNDLKNNLSNEYHLILDTLQPLPGIEFTHRNGITIQQLYPLELTQFYEGLPNEVVSAHAKRIFQWNTKTQVQINTFKQNLPLFDYGVHVRTGDKITTGEMKAIPLDHYLQRIHQFQQLTTKQTLQIYLMTDSKQVVDYFQRKKDSSWTIVSIPSPSNLLIAHHQETYNNQPREIVFRCFYHFLAELQIVQSCPHILCTFSSNIGRFLDLVKEGTIESLD